MFNSEAGQKYRKNPLQTLISKWPPKLGGAFASIALGVALQIIPVWAAPCCGGGSSLPSLITGDDRSQMSVLVSRGAIIGDAPPQGIPIFRSSEDAEEIDTINLSGAYLLTEGLQIGTVVPLIRRSREVGTDLAAAQGIGDLALDIAYEFLPEFSYSPWKPKGFLFVQSTLPTSPSIYDANEPYLLDARSRGFLSISLGAALLKTLGNWDFLLSAELHRALSRTFQNADGSTLTLSPGWGGSTIVGIGLSPGGGAFRMGLSLSPIYEDAIRSQGEITSVSESQLVWNASLQFSYVLEGDWAVSAVYTDQTLVGPVKNVSLSRIFGAAIQKRWPL